MFEYNAFHIAPWGHELVIYFTLIGATAMTYIVLSLPHLTNIGTEVVSEKMQKSGYVLIMLALLVSAYLLTFDLGQPQRAINILIYHHMTSPLVWGGILLLVFGACSAFMLYALFFGESEKHVHWAALIGSIAAVGFPLYTGADLSAHQGRVLWHDSVISVYFVALSATSGTAVVALLGLALGESSNDRLYKMLWRVINWSLKVSLVIFALITAKLMYGDAQEQQVLGIINSEMSFEYWGLGLVVGLLIPLALMMLKPTRHNPVMIAVAGTMGLVGAYAVRAVIMYAGQLPQLYY